ncbi:MAG TPA: hypothetical protein DDW85_13545 [Porphyromonadaceae bacterium]|nr:hypothetical protein [Porphyromonadaceae bacterium]
MHHSYIFMYLCDNSFLSCIFASLRTKTMMKKILPLLLVIGIWSCSNNDPSENAARLRIKLTDAPSLTLKGLQIEIDSIEVSLYDTGDDWVALDYGGGTYNMLPLSNGNTQQISDQYFPADGIIQRIKLLFGDGNKLQTTEGDKELILAEENREVIIEGVNAALYSHVVCNIVIDINALISVTESNGNYYLNPVMRAFDEAFTGSLRGYVSPAMANATALIASEGDTLISLPEPDGKFMFLGLKEGPWKIFLVSPPDSGYVDTVFVDTVKMGKIRDIVPKPIVLKKRTEDAQK